MGWNQQGLLRSVGFINFQALFLKLCHFCFNRHILPKSQKDEKFHLGDSMIDGDHGVDAGCRGDVGAQCSSDKSIPSAS